MDMCWKTLRIIILLMIGLRPQLNFIEKWAADCIIGEVNNGGDLIENTLRGVDPNIPYKEMRASRGKVSRAEPIAALYEQEKVHHVGSFNKLEDQLCSLTVDFNRTKAGYSPDRADALVWALTELMLGDMDSMGLYEYYRKTAASSKNDILKKSTRTQSAAYPDMVRLHRGTSDISTLYGMQGDKFDVDGQGFVTVPIQMIGNLMQLGFVKAKE